MNRQKKIALINDFTGFGRCSISVALPIISAMKIQCCAIPTAILSAHTGFSNFFLKDFTPYMDTYMKSWQEIDINFDGITTGFLSSKEQINQIIKFFDIFKKSNTITLIDPVMGDNGKLYTSYTKEMCEEMKKLIPYADIITPNLTELCYLLDIDYNNFNISDDNLLKECVKLSEIGPSKIVITGIQTPAGKITNFIYEKNKEFKKIVVDKIGGDRPGTGDIFTSVLFGNILNGVDFYNSIKKATEFLNKSIDFTNKLNIPKNYGLCFEEFLKDL